MDIELKIKVKPFTIPKFVIEDKPKPKPDRGLREPLVIPLSDLTPEQLDILCEDFRRGVFSEAGKSQPGRVEKDYRYG